MSYISSKRFSGVQLYKKSDGDIIYYIRYKDLEGKLIREKIGSKLAGITEVYCNQKRNDILNKLRLGEEVKTKYHKKKKIYFEDVWNFFISNKAMTKKRKDELLGVWDKYLKNFFKEDVSIKNLQRFRKDSLRTTDNPKGLSARTIDMRIAVIGTSFNFWNKMNKDNILENPIPQFRILEKDLLTKKERQDKDIKRDRYLTVDEISILKSYVEDLHIDIKLFLLISLSTGARLSSIMSIQKKDIQNNKVILINHKIGGSTYTGFLNNDVLEMLSPRLNKLNLNESIFTLSQRQIQRRLQRVLNKLFNENIDTKDSANRVVVHTLRHTFASKLVENGVPLIKVRKLLDHKDINTTMRYSHLAPDSGLSDVMNMWE